MIVDDDSNVLIFLRDVFEREGFEVLAVDAGKDCIQELEQGFKGIVLLDLRMPFMDGWQTLREIVRRGLNKQVAISIITAYPSTSKMRGLEPYISEYFPKPFNLSKLVSQVKSLDEMLYN
jgi:DNA-binding response OmpR family regulator